MAIKTDNELDNEIRNQKNSLQQLQVKVQAFIVGHTQLEPKERAKALSEIQKAFQAFPRFFDKVSSSGVKNVGTKFAADTLKQSYQTLYARWRKFETTANLF